MEAVRDRPRSKDWPLIIGISEVPVHYGRAVAETVNARTLVDLNLKKRENPHRFIRRGDELQFSTRRSEHDPDGVDVDGVDTPKTQHGEHVDHVEVVHQIVGELDDRGDQERFSGHQIPSPRGASERRTPSARATDLRDYTRMITILTLGRPATYRCSGQSIYLVQQSKWRAGPVGRRSRRRARAGRPTRHPPTSNPEPRPCPQPGGPRSRRSLHAPTPQRACRATRRLGKKGSRGR